LFFFSLPSVITDAAERDTLRWGAVALIVAASIQPFKVQALFQTAPAIATVVSFALAVMLLRRESSVGSARRRAIYVPTPVGYALGNSFRRAYASNSDSYSPSSHGPSRTIGTFAWIKAADYEVFGSRRFGWAKTLLWSVLLYSGFAYGLGNPSFAAMMGLLQISAQGHGLRGKWAYPISRTSRANLAFVLSLGDSIAYSVLSVIVLTLLVGNPVSHGQSLTVFPTAFIWAPIAQWLGATAIDSTQKRMKSTSWIVRSSVQWVAMIVLVVFTYFVLARLGRSTSFTVAVAAGAALGISVQVCYWLALRRHFTRKDLV